MAATATTAEVRSTGEADQHDIARRVNAAACAALRSMRDRSGRSLAQIAARSGTHRPIVGRILRGLHVPTLDTCYRIALACDGDVREVLAAVDRELGLDGAR